MIDILGLATLLVTGFTACAEFGSSSFTGLDLAEPGVVGTADWRPTGPADTAEGPERDQIYAGVGRKTWPE